MVAVFLPGVDILIYLTHVICVPYTRHSYWFYSSLTVRTIAPVYVVPATIDVAVPSTVMVTLYPSGAVIVAPELTVSEVR